MITVLLFITLGLALMNVCLVISVWRLYDRVHFLEARRKAALIRMREEGIEGWTE